jgi:hypothetical protein
MMPTLIYLLKNSSNMATQQEYDAACPIITGLGVTASQIETQLASIPEPPAKAADPTITKAIVLALFNQLYAEVSLKRAFEKHGGYGVLAKQHGLRKYQIKQIIAEFEAARSIYITPAE